MIFPQQWKKEHPNYLSYMPIVPIPSLKAIQLESQAISSWKGTCDRLANISKPTLVIVGTDDGIVPPAYSLSLVQHGVYLQLIKLMQWVLNGKGKANQVSICVLNGLVYNK